MITNLVNPALKLAYGVASATITFSTDATPAIQTTVTGAINSTQFTVASGSGLLRGDFLSVEGGGLGGAIPWVAVINGPANVGLATSQTLDIPFPSLRAAVTNAVANRYERIETRFHAKKLVLTNTTNGDTYTWDQSLGMLPDTANKVDGVGGGTSSLSYNALGSRANCVAIHPNLLLPSCNFTLYCEYEYYS